MNKFTPKENNLRQLNRIGGQIEGIKKMIEDDRSASELIAQLRSVRLSVKVIEAYILERYLEECALQSCKSEKDREAKLEEFKKLYTRFSD